MHTKQSIRLGISSCLLGNKVRYDGGHRLDQLLIDTLSPIVEWVPVCPEVESGLPVPREAMQLVAGPGTIRLVETASGADHTERMMQWVHKRVEMLREEGLCGFVFKARSPSCGVRDAIVASSAGPGLFAGAVLSRCPDLPVEDEEGLHDPSVREAFIRKIFAYLRASN